VVSCRVRLARNVVGYPFLSKLPPEQALEICEQARDALYAAQIDGETWWVPMAAGNPVLRLLLLERNLISRDLVSTEVGGRVQPGRAVAFGRTETLSVMVNEEDHLRIQGMAAGFDLSLAWERAQQLDRFLEERLPFAHTEKFGYLTGCPTNVGTGMRASVMLHLPALGLVRSELEKVFTAAQRTGLAVRGLHGEGSRAAGDYYQISNQITLGRTEQQLIEDLSQLVPVISDFERKVRETLLQEHRTGLQDRITRSYGVLRTARALPTDAALAHLSNVRLGVHLGFLGDMSLDVLNELGIQVHKGHIQAIARADLQDEILDASERDKLRASHLRKRLADCG
jgi:protein arginine kinase